jgi:DNA-binding CsgD family transcriptional regulator
MSAGKATKEIAAQLKVSPKTVSTYRARLLEKLELKTTADLIRFAVEHGLT